MSSLAIVNGNRFEERRGKLYLNGNEIINNKVTNTPYPITPLFVGFSIGVVVGAFFVISMINFG